MSAQKWSFSEIYIKKWSFSEFSLKNTCTGIAMGVVLKIHALFVHHFHHIYLSCPANNET